MIRSPTAHSRSVPRYWDCTLTAELEERKMTRFVVTAGLTCALALPGIAGAQSTRPSTPSSTPSKPASDQPKTGRGAAAGQTAGAAGAMAAADKSFVMEAARGGMAEVELGKLATEKASNADVKQFGQRMVDDHGKANDELKALASQKSLTIPAELDAKHKATQTRLSKLSGDAFDKAYMAEMVADHNKDVAAFTRESQNGKDADVKAWAGKTLPTLQDHQKSAKEIAAKVRGAAAGAGAGAKKSGAAPKKPGTGK
jgi:putative membrane protein